MFAELTEDDVSKWIMNEYDNASSSRDTILQYGVYSLLSVFITETVNPLDKTSKLQTVMRNRASKLD